MFNTSDALPVCGPKGVGDAASPDGRGSHVRLSRLAGGMQVATSHDALYL